METRVGMMSGFDGRDRARSALRALDPGVSRDTWIRIAMAARAAGLNEEDFQAWSASAPNYAGAADCRRVWRSIKVDGTITANTLFYEARKTRWRDPAQASFDVARAIRVTDTTEIWPKQQAPAKPARDLAAIFDGYPLATSDHPYLLAKRGDPAGLRIVPADDGLNINGQRVAGWLAVPALSLDGTLRTVQYVPPPTRGRKLNAPGAAFGNDGMFVVGDILADGRIFIVEGIGQAWSCARADFHAAAVVTFGSGRFNTVAKVLRQRYPLAQLVLVADRGKERYCATLADQLSCAWIEMPSDKPQNYDVNDYERDHSTEGLEALLRSARTPALRYRMLTGDEVMNSPPQRWLVRGVIPTDGFIALYGPTGSGKSFLAFDLAAAIAGGAPEWFGRRVTAAPVTYLCLEGEAGLGKRALAWTLYNGRALPHRLRFGTQSLDLRSAQDLDDIVVAVIAAGGGGGLLVIDTLNRAAPGADENASADMGALIAGTKALQHRTRCSVLLVHHTGKDGTKGLRGHSSLFAALDAAVEVSRIDGRHEWVVAKSKDDTDGERYAFALPVIGVGEDEEGQPVTSCVVGLDDTVREVRRVKLPQGGNQRIAMDALAQPLCESHDFSKGDAPFGRPCLEIEAAVTIVASHLTCEAKRRNERARAAITGLVANGVYGSKDGWLWRI
ncbi:AAA family ATPase [Burkholderia ambifaria]|uniref:AAA family ATPase n=1 Tax=Burkholderia ambifaria TaxID=152480 RepID=UPI002FE1D219